MADIFRDRENEHLGVLRTEIIKAEKNYLVSSCKYSVVFKLLETVCGLAL
jgi:hypothetical protein